MNLYHLAEQLGSVLYNKHLTVATAESCTGGWVAQALTAIPGSSNWFLQGWITYSNESKSSQLDVPFELIVKYGAVSEQVVCAMVEGALYHSKADIALATTGVAGPDGGTTLNPIGAVWIAVAFKNSSIITEKLLLDGNRHEIRKKTVASILNKLLDNLL